MFSKLTQQDTEWSESSRDKSERVDVLLRHLMRTKTQEYLRSGIVPERMTLDEIADYCGVDRMVIHRAERTALQKIRSKFTKCDLE